MTQIDIAEMNAETLRLSEHASTLAEQYAKAFGETLAACKATCRTYSRSDEAGETTELYSAVLGQIMFCEVLELGIDENTDAQGSGTIYYELRASALKAYTYDMRNVYDNLGETSFYTFATFGEAIALANALTLASYEYA